MTKAKAEKEADSKVNTAPPVVKPATKNRSAWKTVLFAILCLVWVAASVVVAQLVIGYILVALIGGSALQEPVWSAVYSALSYTIALILILFAVPRMRAKSRAELGLRGWPTWTDIGLAPVGFIVYLLLASGLTALFMCFPWFDAGQAQEIGFSLSLAGTDRLIAFITLVVVAPVAEEIIFRGWLYGKLRTRFSDVTSDKVGMILSILLVSLLFGIVHLQWNVGVNVFAMSIVLCSLREITGTIYAGILLHMLKNGVAFYALYILGTGF